MEEIDEIKDMVLNHQTDFTDRDIAILDWLNRQGFLSGKGSIFLSKVALDRAINDRLKKQGKTTRFP